MTVNGVEMYEGQAGLGQACVKGNDESDFEVAGGGFELRPLDLATVVDVLVCTLDLTAPVINLRGCYRGHHVQWKQPRCWR
jgi:hypothetical protein